MIIFHFVSSPSVLVNGDSKAESLSPRERAVSSLALACCTQCGSFNAWNIDNSLQIILMVMVCRQRGREWSWT